MNNESLKNARCFCCDSCPCDDKFKVIKARLEANEKALQDIIDYGNAVSGGGQIPVHPVTFNAVIIASEVLSKWRKAAGT